jgi:EmrB/QacA subfamily drug resistance transporter
LESEVIAPVHLDSSFVSTAPAERHYGMILALLVTAVGSYALLQSLVAPALPQLQRAFHASAGGVSWVVTGYLLSAAVATPLIGRLGDMYGKARVLTIVLGALSVGTAVSALASSLLVMVAGRVIQGAAGGLLPLSYGILRDEFPRERVAGGVGLISSVMGFGGVVGIVVAGPIIGALSYHFLFWLPLVPLLGATIAVRFVVPESPVRIATRANWVGAALMATGLAAILLAVSEAGRWQWSSARTIACIAVGIVLLLLWVDSESRSSHPLVDMRMLRMRGVWTTNVVAFLAGFGMWASFILLPQFVQAPSRVGYGFSASVAGTGLFQLPGVLGMVVFGWQSGRIDKAFGSRVVLVCGSATALGGFALLTFAHAAPWEFYVGALLLGLGAALTFAAMANLLIEAVGPEQTGVATGMNSLIRTVGGAFGGAIVATMLTSSVGASGYPAVRSFTAGFGVCALAAGVSVAIALLVPRRRACGVAGPPLALVPHGARCGLQSSS